MIESGEAPGQNKGQVEENKVKRINDVVGNRL